MNCERIREILADECIGTLDPENRKLMEMHLAGCRACREEREEWRQLWRNIGEIPLLEPDHRVRSRFHALLEGYRNGMDCKTSKHRQLFKVFVPWLRPALQFGMGCLLVLLGVIVGYRIRSDAGGHADIAGLHEEISETRQMLAVALMNQSSASERLKGLNWSVQVRKPEPEFTEALAHTLDEDPNVNVRLAAIDALARFADLPEVRKKLVDSLPEQDSPLVQIMLIRVLVQLQERRSVEILKSLSTSESQNPQVREQAQWGLRQLL